MVVTAVQGSPHGMQGSTGKLLSSLLEGARASGAEINLFCLGDLRVSACRACDVCHRTGECPVPDDYQQVRNAMLASDAVVLATPNYLSSVTAQMKALLDRLCGPLHINALRGKYAAAVVTSGGTETKPVAEYLLTILRRLGCWTVGSVEAQASALSDAQCAQHLLSQAFELGRRLVQTAASRERFPEQEKEIEAAAEHMRRLVMSRAADWPYEYQVWQSRE